jgi:predicted RNase H-like nuclease (RuvC/YqgF family)
MQGETDRKVLEIELVKARGLEKDKRQLNERIIDLEDEIKKLSDVNNSLGYRQTLSEEESARSKNEIAQRDKKIEELRMRLKDSDKQK